MTATAQLSAQAVSPRTTVGLFLHQSRRFGDGVLVRHFDPGLNRWTEVSWNDFREAVVRVAAGLVAVGVKAQDRVLLVSENRIEWLYCDLAIQAAGAITVPVYANLLPASVQVIAEDSGAAVAIVSGAAQAQKLAAMAAPPAVVAIDADVAAWLRAPSGPMRDEVESRMAALGPEDVATIAYTSGTSGRPKGAVITHGTIVNEVESCREAYDIRPDDVILSLLPYAHIFERIAAFYFGALFAGAELDLSRGPERIVDDLQEVRPTCMNAVPRLFEKFAQRVDDEMKRRSLLTRALFAWSLRAAGRWSAAVQPGPWMRLQRAVAERLVLRRLRERMTGGRLRFFLCGSAPLSPAVERFFWALGMPVYQGWGMTELTCAATCNTVAQHKLGTVGRALPRVELRLAPDGEIEVRGPGVMKEYYRNVTATAETLIDGWVHTGDVGQIDADGFLTIIDRKKDLLKTSGGKYVAPQPIELKLRQDPHIQTAVLVGDGRRYVTALIVPDWDLVAKELGVRQPPDELTGDPRVLSLVKRRVDEVNADLDRFETVKYFRLLARPLSIESDELTPTLKVKRRVVQQHYASLIDEMYAA